MSERLYRFDDEVIERLHSMLEWYESVNPSINKRMPERPVVEPAGFSNEVVRVTSATLTNIGASSPMVQGYPGKIQLVKSAITSGPSDFLPAYSDLGSCWVLGLNGEALPVGKYRARRTGTAQDGSPFFVLETTAAGALTTDISGGGLTVNPTTKLTFDANDFTATNPNAGEFHVNTNGYTGVTSFVSVSDVSCSGGTLSKTTKTLAIPIRDGLIYTAPTYT